MTEAAAEAPRADSEREGAGVLVRGYRAFELLFSAHAKVAQREASQDLRRVLTGLVLVILAVGLFGMALVLAQAAAVLLVQKRFQWDLATSIGAVAGGDTAVALVLVLLARARLSTPVLAETRAMMKKAASVIRG